MFSLLQEFKSFNMLMFIITLQEGNKEIQASQT